MVKNIYMAPMEGITGYIFRNAHAKYFPGVTAYFTPFLAPHRNRELKGKEIKDILPENNQNIPVVPQILTNHAEDFVRTAEMLKKMGYRQVDFNLGCPSGTVVAKRKGSGFLVDLQELDDFFEQIFSGLSSELKISVKTRIGIENPEEFPALLDVYNKYPIEMLTIHPRLQKDYYNNFPNMEMFRYSVAHSKNLLCYNGDLFSEKKVIEFVNDFPSQENLMIGRGVLKNPALITLLLDNGFDRDDVSEIIKDFHSQLLSDYTEAFSGDRPVLFKMKEIWVYLGNLYEDSEKFLKKIKKSQTIMEYNAIANTLLCQPIKEEKPI